MPRFGPGSPIPPLTKAHETYEKPGIVLAYTLGTLPIFKGALVGLTPTGEIAPLSPATPMRFLGVSGETADPAKGARRAALAKMGSFVFAPAGFEPAPADLGRPVFAASDWQVALDPEGLAHPVIVGTIVAVEAMEDRRPGVRVRIDLHTV